MGCCHPTADWRFSHRRSDSIDSLAFSPDGQTLATGNGDDAVQLWNVSYLTDLPSYICASAGTSFNRSEWTYYVPGLAYQNICPQ